RQAAAGAVLDDPAGGDIGMERDVATHHCHQADVHQLDEIPSYFGNADPGLVGDGLEPDREAAILTRRLPGLRLADTADMVNQAADRIERPSGSGLAEAAVGGTVQLRHLEPGVRRRLVGASGFRLRKIGGNCGDHEVYLCDVARRFSLPLCFLMPAKAIRKV
ncbi:MAG: hypothetical protein EBQ89_00485, partial [Alphaproteobacteria bacterium]|nr:hypothetical protein [Alphaproteobacteria bacterium]